MLCAHSDRGENAPVLRRDWELLERAKDRFGLVTVLIEGQKVRPLETAAP